VEPGFEFVQSSFTHLDANMVTNPPTDMSEYFMDVVRPTVLAELDRQALVYIKLIDAMP